MLVDRRGVLLGVTSRKVLLCGILRCSSRACLFGTPAPARDFIELVINRGVAHDAAIVAVIAQGPPILKIIILHEIKSDKGIMKAYLYNQCPASSHSRGGMKMSGPVNISKVDGPAGEDLYRDRVLHSSSAREKGLDVQNPHLCRKTILHS